MYVFEKTWEMIGVNTTETGKRYTFFYLFILQLWKPISVLILHQSSMTSVPSSFSLIFQLRFLFALQ